MKEEVRRAYLKLIYFALLEIRDMSMKSSIVSNSNTVRKINKLSDIFHNLPNLLYDEKFDEELFWWHFNEIAPDRIMKYKEIFDHELFQFTEFEFQIMDPWRELIETEKEALMKQFYKELIENNDFNFDRVSAIARRIDNDDVLFKVRTSNSTELYLVVHLTWNSAHPRMQKFMSIEEWRKQVMIKDNEEYEG